MEKSWAKVLEKRKKVLLLHPQQRKALFEILAGRKDLKERNFQKKRFGKACEIRKCFLHLHPAKHGKFIERLEEELRE
ncbi:hypothetical protein LPB248_13805 [Flavobacterium sp. LPB0248]|uniref:hypothetical protein n=1 Tax=Flavobacterium sp. LPB0248 TaxID=2614441 RepID=UPI0015A5B32F|nr:hypothetical protein [Flavobacterium sp. LPB0248]QLC65810.1 hypothetical protein LPB248_05765 [Flavobacterium sp. LPB0248]QLC67339.1 hypothetical protein LPB248_13805 [Flavobacterium sp. LPB0248]